MPPRPREDRARVIAQGNQEWTHSLAHWRRNGRVHKRGNARVHPSTPSNAGTAVPRATRESHRLLGSTRRNTRSACLKGTNLPVKDGGQRDGQQARRRDRAGLPGAPEPWAGADSDCSGPWTWIPQQYQNRTGRTSARVPLRARSGIHCFSMKTKRPSAAAAIGTSSSCPLPAAITAQPGAGGPVARGAALLGADGGAGGGGAAVPPETRDPPRRPPPTTHTGLAVPTGSWGLTVTLLPGDPAPLWVTSTYWEDNL